MNKQSNTKDMTVGSPFSLILNFAIPILLGNIFQQMYGMVDTVIVGRYLGVGPLAAVGSVGSIQFLIIGFCLGSCGGMAIPVAQSFGAKDEKDLRVFVINGVWLASVIAIVVTTVTVILSKNILNWMKTPSDIIDDAHSYFSIILIGIPAAMLYNFASAIMRALGDSRRPLYFLIFSSFMNIGLDLLFIVAFGMGCAGAAWATILSQLISGLLCVFYMVKKLPIIIPKRDELRPSAVHIKRLANMGFPMGLQFSITAIGSVILASAVNSLGSLAVASMTAANKVQSLFFGMFDATGATMATYCGQNLGAGKISRIGRGMRISFIILAVYCVVLFISLYFFGKTIALLFVDSNEITILNNVRTYLIINGATTSLLAIIMVLRNMIQGLGYSKVAMFAGLFEMIARTAVAALLVPVFGFVGACMANPAAWLAADLFLIPCYISVMRKIRRTHPEYESQPV